MPDRAPQSLADYELRPTPPGSETAFLRSIVEQLEESQWWSAEQLLDHERQHLRALLDHSYETVPFYRKRLEKAGFRPGRKVTKHIWQRIPILTREEVQAAGSNLDSNAVPDAHGAAFEVSTSGSTGMPVTVKQTALSRQYWHAITTRDVLWHGIDVSGLLCMIRPFDPEKAKYPDGMRFDNWGSVALTFLTGPAVALHIHTSIEKQVDWVRRCEPSHLVSVTSNLQGLAAYCLENSISLPSLKSLSSIGEVVTQEIRETCRAAWGIGVKDIYSSVDVGYVALQCPDHEHYHLQSETACIEIIDDRGRRCGPGEIGRVIVTPFHSYATPLIRYAVGDYAQVGPPCPCGRGLPVITKVLGRVRNRVRLPDGRTFFPNLQGQKLAEFAPVKQFQVIQKTLEALEVRLVATRPLTANEEGRVKSHLQMRLEYPFDIDITYHDIIERSEGGKFEEFKSLIHPS